VQDLLTAIHESAHIVIADLFGLRFGDAKITDRALGYGECVLYMPHAQEILSLDVPGRQLCEPSTFSVDSKVLFFVLAAGSCAETLVYKPDSPTVETFGDDQCKMDKVVRFREKHCPQGDSPELLVMILCSFLRVPEVLTCIRSLAERLLSSGGSMKGKDLAEFLGSNAAYSIYRTKMQIQTDGA